jgi:hypothetical protein
MVRTTPLLAGLTYAGTINGNAAAVTGYINGSPSSTNSWALLNSTTSNMVATGCTPPPGYGCGAPNGTAITLTRPLPVIPPVVAPYAQPTMPLGVFAISGAGQISLSWSPVIAASSYNIYWGTTPGITTASTKIIGATSPYTHTGLVAGSTYYYRVSAISAGVESLSDEVFSVVYAGGTPSGAFVVTGNMTTARGGAHTATLLTNGNVLVTGGTLSTPGVFGATTTTLASAEIFNSATGVFSATGNMLAARKGHTATLLPSGKVLVVGGTDNTGALLAGAELFDPATGIFTATGSMQLARTGHTATVLSNGKILILCGDGGFGGYASMTAEEFDPSTGVFTFIPQGFNPITGATTNLGTGIFPQGRSGGHTSTLLANGQVLISGGNSYTNTPAGAVLGATASAEIYDLLTSKFTLSSPMGTARTHHMATLLPNGKVLIVGGTGFLTSELFDVTTGTFTPSGASISAPTTLTLLPNGEVLCADGVGAEIYNPVTGLFIATGSPPFGSISTSTLLPNGTVLYLGSGVSAALYQ